MSQLDKDRVARIAKAQERQAQSLAQRLRDAGVNAVPYYSGEGLGMWVPLEEAERLLNKREEK